MKVYVDCLPCNLRQALEASRMATDDEEILGRIMEDTLAILGRYKDYGNSPQICREVHRLVKQYTGVDDPYRKIKDRDIKAALSLLPLLRRITEGKADKRYWALKAAATGNVFDSAIASQKSHEKLFEAEFKKPFAVCDMDVFEDKLKSAKSLVVIADNAGETVFDRILLEELSYLDLTYAVRSAPVLNDAIEADARASGIGEYADIIPSGCNLPGTMLGECSEEFLDRFCEADIVISKGQGNLETLLGCGRDVFFLLKAKCLVIARLLGVALNDYVFMYKENGAVNG